MSDGKTPPGGPPDPLNEGSAQQIYRHFIGPLTSLKGPDQTLAEFHHDVVFLAKQRDIVRWRVDRGFTMPGLFYMAPTVKIQGVGQRKVVAGTTLWVRTDTTLPYIDIGLCPRGQPEQLFCLTPSEWGEIRLRCTEVEPPPKNPTRK